MKTGGLAAVVVSYQSRPHIGACITSLLQAGLGASAIVVWDNASSDDSVSGARDVAPGLTVVAHTTNCGFAAAVNGAAREVPGADLLLVNPDAVVSPGTIAALQSAMDADAAISVVGARILDVRGLPQPDAWRFPTPRLTVAGAVAGFGRASRPVRSASAGVEDVGESFVPFTVVLLRRRMFERLGGLDEDYWLYGEDADYCYRARQARGRIVIATEAVARHVGGASSEQERRVSLQLAAGDLFRRKHFGRWRARLAELAVAAAAGSRVALAPSLRRARLLEPDDWQEWSLVWRHIRN
jgi:GT2 family glycosyltransferase